MSSKITQWEKTETFLLLRHLMTYIQSNNITEAIAVLEMPTGLTDPR